MAYVLVLIGSKTVFAVNEGNNAVYYEATAGDAMTTSQKNYTWDNTVQEDSDTFDLQSNNYDVRLKESGRYLIMYNLPTSLGTSTNMRQEIRSGISVGGTLLEPYGTATGYNRATAGADEDNQAAATVIDHVYDAGTLTNNDVKVVWQNTDDATTKGTADSGAGLTLVKLNSDWAHSAYSEAGGNFSLTAPTAYNTYNWASITLDTNDINDGVKISHSTSSNTDDITLSDAGYYLVTYSVHFNGTGSGRSNGLTRLTLGGTEVDATRVSAYVRQRQSNNDGYASYSGIIYNSSASATLNLEATIEGEASAALDVEDVGITITKLPDNANYFRNVLSADQAVEGVESAITWPTPTEVDSLFSYSGSNSSRITIPAGVSNQDYLFFSSQYNFRSIATNGTRSIPRWRWRKNGTTIYGYGYHSAYNRGNQSSTGTFAAGSSGGFLTNLTSSDYVEIMAVDQSTTGDVAQDYKASLTGVQGVEVGSLFPTEFISVVDPDNGTGTDYTTLSAWEAAVQTDLTATTTKVFSHGGITGAIADTDSVTGASSGATADVVHATSTQILLENISGTFESGEQIRVDVSNYVTSSDLGNSAIAVAKCRSTGGSADTATVSVNGWTTDENNYVKIWTDPDDEYGRHNGKWSESKYRLENGPSATLFSVGDSYTKVEGIQISHTGALYSAFSFYNAADLIGVEISESIIRRTSATSSTHNGVSAYADEIKVYNNIIYSEGPSTGRGIRVYDFSADYYIYNNTISGFSGTGGIGILADAGTVYIMNNIVQDCDTDYSYSGSSSDSSSDYNISSDSTAPGSNSIKNTSIEFANEAGYDFHLSDSDTTARDAGTNSVFTDSDLNFYTDVDGTVRGGTPDIGADEVPVDFSSILFNHL